MIEIIPKASIGQLTTNINSRELACQCDNLNCGFTIYSPELLDRFEELRHDLGSLPITILSAFRCHHHNEFVGGLETSRHKIGFALDLAVPHGVSIDEFTKRCWRHFDVAIKYKNRKFVHVHNHPWREIL